MTDLMQILRWLRMIGDDSIFKRGAISFVYFARNLMWQRPTKKAAIVPPPSKPAGLPAVAEVI
jgi:hypothetical protein